ncbi:protein enabled [Salix suchowensis]|nr:protein enabled [Salix suchowensis]
MDSQRGSVLSSWAYYCQGKTMDELRNSLLYTTLELEQTRVAVQEELRKKDDQLDEAQEKCRRLVIEKVQLQQQPQYHQNAPLSGISSIEDEPRRGIDSSNGFSSSDCEESIVSSPVIDPTPQPPQLPPPAAPQAIPQAAIELVPEKPLPEKGKLLQAVMKAGPLLQTLLLAGPLPQWRHPPPPLESFEIPPVTMPSPPPAPQLIHQDSFINLNGCNRKRARCDGPDSPTKTKYQNMALH